MKASETTAIFKHASVKAVHDINPGEIAFILTNIPSKTGLTEPEINTSLNGTGSEAANKFPDDEHMQVEEIEAHLKTCGMAIRQLTESTFNTRPGLALRIKGICNSFSYVDMPFGVYTKASVPLPSTIRASNRKVPTGTPIQKVTLIQLPYEVKSVGEKLKTHIGNHLKNAELYKKSMDGRCKGASKKIAALQTMTKSDLFNALIVIERLVKTNVINQIQFSGAATNLNTGGASQTEILLGLASALGLLGEERYPIRNISIDRIKQEKYNSLKREILLAVNFDGTIGNLSFGWDDANNTNPGKDNTTGKIMSNTAHGRMLFNQLNLWKANISAQTDFILDDTRLIQGKVVKGATQGGHFTYLK